MITSLLPRLCSQRPAFRLGSLLLKVLLFLPLPALGQTRAVSTASIPFSFTINGQQMPAGDYVLYRVTQNIYSLRSRDWSFGASAMVYTDAAAKMPESSKLVFRNYGSTYLLDSFWTAGSSQGLRFTRSKAEMSAIALQTNAATTSVLLASANSLALKH
ncbi:hypothetical protein [Terriglobus sp.]|uniref:hypothetical protein n=1 Tax=Terriglobus sp. TaxID=1889013 RepID=UPI003B00CABA